MPRFHSEIEPKSFSVAVSVNPHLVPVFCRMTCVVGIGVRTRPYVSVTMGHPITLCLLDVRDHPVVTNQFLWQPTRDHATVSR